MNLELLRTFDASYPEHDDGVPDSGSEALIAQFNKRGTMLAVGYNDGLLTGGLHSGTSWLEIFPASAVTTFIP